MEPTTYPIRYCTGGCANGDHHAHTYSIDPVDGPMNRDYLCPGNLGEAKEYVDGNEPTGYGFIADASDA